MVKNDSIYGFEVAYEENAAQGASHLRNDLDREEARVFFDQARTKGTAHFEDDEERQYALMYQNGGYVLVRRERN